MTNLAELRRAEAPALLEQVELPHELPREAGATGLPPDPRWYKDAVIYELSVRSFQDSNGDGIGDFNGLTQRLDYLAQLGVSCLWLLPFFPSPMRDGGYDISDYSSIHPQLGTMRDFRRFVRAAHARGIRVITELVINHTSDQHPWFQRAREAPRGSAARNMYVWSDTPEAYTGTRIIFTDTETSNWAWDPVAGQYYWHRFFSHQPDLNFANPRVVAAVKRFMKFWFDAGVDGLRLDAIPYLCEREGTNNENLPETHRVLKDLRAFVDANYADRVLLAEANQWPADVVDYFGDGDECHMAFHFPVMPRLFMALRQEDRHPIVDILDQTPPIPEAAQWVLFLRNHDELTLEMVKDDERDYMYSAYAADPRMRVNVGIRRRLAPLLSSSRRAMELLNSLLFSLPGTPILYYGDEIGMGDNIFLGDRDGVRTPMQWTGDRNAGFSSADPARMSLPVIVDPLFGYPSVNVDAQERSPSSLLNWMRRMIALRRERRVFGRGSIEMLHPANRHVVAFVRRYEGETVLVVANLSRFVQPVQLNLSEFIGSTPVEMLGKTPFPMVGDAPYPLSLGPHTFYWFDLQPHSASPTAEGARGEGDLASLAVAGEWDDLVAGEALARLERDVLPAFIARQRWAHAGERRIRSVRVRDVIPLRRRVAAWGLVVEVSYASGAPEAYALPLAVATGRGARHIRAFTPGAVLAGVRGARGEGVLCDAMASDAACLALVELVRTGASSPTSESALAVERTRAFSPLYTALDDDPAFDRSVTEAGDFVVRLGTQFVLRLVRRLEPGPHPAVEVSRHLRAAGFNRAPALAGAVAYGAPGEQPSTVALLHEFVWNQGDGRQFTLAQLARYFDDATDLESPATTSPVDALYSEVARVLGTRTAEMHLALAQDLDDPAFTPEPFGRADASALVEQALARADRVATLLREAHPHPAAGTDAAAVLAGLRGLRARLRRLARARGPQAKVRLHGNYQLDQVLWVRNDFVITGPDCEPGPALADRRARGSALSDVASMLHSISSAAHLGLRQHAETLPDSVHVAAQLRVAAARWEDEAIARFLEGYLATAEGAPFLPPDPEGLRAWLDLHLIDRALQQLERTQSSTPNPPVEAFEASLHATATLLQRLS